MTVTGQPFDAFSDLMKSTPPMMASGQNEFAIYMGQRTWALNAMMQHNAMDKRYFGGVEVKDNFVDDFQTTGTYRRPNGETVYTLPQYFNQWKSYPALFLDYVSWTNHEFVANNMIKDLRGGVLRKKLKDLRNTKYTMQKVQQAVQFERDLLAKPDYEEMEGPGAFRPRSIFCYYNEGLPSDFTTLQGIDYQTVTQYQCERVEVNMLTNENTSAWAGFLGLDILASGTSFEKIPYANINQTPRDTPQKEFWCSTWGYVLIQSQLRASNDFLRWEAHDGGVLYPKHGGIPFRRVTSLDDKEVWTLGADPVGGTEQTATVKGPRYVLVDYAGVEPRFHDQFHFYHHEVMQHPRVIGTKVKPIETWWMLLSMDPRTGGVLSPSVSLTVPAGV